MLRHGYAAAVKPFLIPIVTIQATASLPHCICTLSSARIAGAVGTNLQAMLSTVYISILATGMLDTCDIRSGLLTTLAYGIDVVLVEG